MRNVIARYLQISDLHIGHVDPDGLTGEFNSAAPKYWGYAGAFKGLYGHSYIALYHLQQAWRGLQQAYPDIRLLVTGDLTACGNPDQFETAADYLGTQLSPPKGRCGLHVANWRELAISGNHDQWPGNGLMLGNPSASLRKHVNTAPATLVTTIPTGNQVRFIFVDTDADVPPKGIKRLLAMGEFHNQLAELNKKMPPHRGKEIRVLLLHHSRTFGDPKYRPPLVITKRSRRLLDQFVVEHGVSVMLCGHTHVASCKVHQITLPGREASKVLEACCGTTTQREYFPYQWVDLAGRAPNWPLEPNTFILHSIEEESGRLFWCSEVHQRDSRGFKPLQANLQPPPYLLS